MRTNVITSPLVGPFASDAPALVGTLVGVAWLLLATVVEAGNVKPNIILILSDDVGAETVGVYGGESYQTPHLDQLARDGIRFDYGHAQPLCTPSRVKIMTGQYNFRNYRHFGYLDPGQKTFAHMLKSAGYSTHIAGKWQLYNNLFEDIQGALPEDAGFDDYLVWQMKNEDKGSRYWGPVFNHDGVLQRHPPSVYGPDVLNERVLRTIEERSEAPFFIYYPMVLAHDPWVITPDMRDESASDQEKFAAMMAYMDKMVGKVRAKVEEEGIADQTLILFIGDNGTDRDITSVQNGRAVTGAKGETIDAGSRVPFMAWGPGLVQPDAVSGSLVNLNDILPTLAELANAPLPAADPADGMSLAGLMRGEGELSRQDIFIHYEPRWPSGVPARYAFDRRWKLYESGGFFDMQLDPLEKSALDTATLEGDAADAYLRLQARIASMPGELKSTGRWIPPYLYKLLGAGVLALGVCALLLWRLVAYLRR